MNAIEKDIMKGLVSILNEASDRYYNTGNPIMTDEQFDIRLNDLKQLEEETTQTQDFVQETTQSEQTPQVQQVQQIKKEIGSTQGKKGQKLKRINILKSLE